MTFTEKLVARIKRAYKKTGMSPIKDEWCNGKKGACPMGVLAIANGVKKKDYDGQEEWADKEFGEKFVGDFIQGYDFYTAGRSRGVVAGRAANKALLTRSV